MKWHIWLALLLTLAGSGAAAKAVLLSNNGSELVVEYTVGEWSISPEDSYVKLRAEDMDFETEPGAPLVPYDNFKIGVPAGSTISYTILEQESTQHPLEKELLPIPELKLVDGISQYNYRLDSDKYRSYSRALITPSYDTFRDFSFAALVIYPFRYSGGKELEVVKRLRIKIEIQGNLAYRGEYVSDSASDSFLKQLINGAEARNWQNVTRATVNYANFGLSNYWVKVETNRDGIHRINYNQLTELPLTDVDPRNFRMFSTAGKVLSPLAVLSSGSEFKEVPIYISHEESGTFGVNDYILFYGSNRDEYEYNKKVQSDQLFLNPYSGNQVFWLCYGGGFSGTPQRITLSSAETTYTESITKTPAYKHVETETHRREDTGYTWYSQRFFGSTSSTHALQAELTDVDPSGVQSLSFRIRQEETTSTTYHSINVQVNGKYILSNVSTGNINFTWSGTSIYSFNRTHNSFVNGNNSIQLSINRGSTDNLYFDWYRLSYWQNLVKGGVQKMVRNPSAPTPLAYQYNLSGTLSNMMIIQVDSLYAVKQIPLQGSYFIATGTTDTKFYLLSPEEAYAPVSVSYIEPEDLTSDGTQRDNLIITPAEFKAKAEVLAQKYYDYYGISSRVVLQEDIMDQFNGGHADPAAIRQAIRYFYYNLPSPKISSVTLIGLGTIDWRNFSGAASAKNKLMVWQLNDSCSDDLFAMIATNSRPELAIGRYPVTSNREMDVMLNNLINYNESPTPGWWRNSMVFLGDDYNNGETIGEDTHTVQVEEAGNTVDSSIIVQKIFAIEYEYDEFQNKPRARSDMFDAINEGRVLWCYIGHGGFDKLGAEDYLNGAVDMGRFANQGKLPFFIASSCSVSHFDYWGYESLGQKLVQMDNVGAIASYGATRISFPDSNQPMLLWVLRYLANDRLNIGQSIMNAKLRFQNTSNNSVYVLLGDPVLELALPQRDGNLEVIGSAGNGQLRALETITVNGEISTANLSGEAKIRIYDTKKSYVVAGSALTHQGTQLYRGEAEVEDSAYSSGFIVPVDVISGNNGLAVSYFWDEANKKDYVNYLYPLSLSDQTQAGQPVDNAGPQMQMYLESMDFRPGDTVSTNSTLFAKIADEHGVNITGSNGHSILLIIDNSLQPIPVTHYFNYDKGSFSSGLLSYPLPELSEGLHTLQLIAFDNYNNPSVISTFFNAKRTTEINLERLLVYPNPVKKDANVTFMLSATAEVNISVYTVRGKKINSFKVQGIQGFNSIAFSATDSRGDTLANNTYFIKVSAISPNGKKAEMTERMVVFK